MITVVTTVVASFTPYHNPTFGTRTARLDMRMAAESALIIQNKGGGHGEIGYHLALELASERGMDVTIVHEGPQKADKPPHSAYAGLDAAGVKVIWADLLDAPATLGSLEGASFSAIVDNWSKSPEQIEPYAAAAKEWGVKSYAYVSSAGMYSTSDDNIIDESCTVKSTDQRKAEELLAEMELPYSCFRPQYIYGPKQGKSYLAPFFDRVTRGRPVCIPNGGEQFVTMTHAADNAAMIAASVCNPAAVGQIFNCATSNLITYNDLAKICAEAAGVEAKIVHYNPQNFEIKKGFFPFRDMAFYVSVAKAQELLGFVPKHTITEDIRWYYADNYVAQGGMDKEVDFSIDDIITA